jgi:hypothetical protein
MLDPNNHLLSLFLNKNNIEDFETVVENQLDRVSHGRNVILVFQLNFDSMKSNVI